MEPDPNTLTATPENAQNSGLVNHTPLVSVLIRSMDRLFLQQALDSIALQTYPNIEVVLLAVRPGHRDVGSHCGRFPVRMVSTGQTVARSAAANRVIEQAHGDFLIFLDDDDWMMPDHVARLAEVLIKSPQTYAVYTGIGTVDADGKPMGSVFDLPYDPIRQMAGNLTPIHAVLFRASVVARGCRFDEQLDRLEDWDFWLQLAQLAPMVHLPGVSAVYRIHESSGVHNDAGPDGVASARIYAKWETQWTPQQLGQIMQRVWTSPELEARVADARAQVTLAEQASASSQATVVRQTEHMAQQAASLSQLTASKVQQAESMAQQAASAERQISVMAQLTASNAQQAAVLAQQVASLAHRGIELRQEREKFEALRVQLQHAQTHVAALVDERRALMGSSSWKVTAPLRWFGKVMKRCLAWRGFN